jgi:hypothetical protein
MGLSGAVVALSTGKPGVEAAALLERAGFALQPGLRAPGWARGVVLRDAPCDQALDAVVAELAATGGGAAIGGCVHDSDLGYMAAAGPGGVVGRLRMDEAMFLAYGYRLWPSGWRRASCAALAAWSRKYAPSPLRPSEVGRFVHGEAPEAGAAEERSAMAEERVFALLARLGLGLECPHAEWDAASRAAPPPVAEAGGLGMSTPAS